MTDRDILLLLGESRQDLGQAWVYISKIARYEPGLAKVAVPRIRKLDREQERLERAAARLTGVPQLGFPLLPVIIGGMSLLGIGGWVFKHHEQTSLEKYRLESIDKCVEQNMAAGISRDEAVSLCQSLFSKQDLARAFSELGKTVLLATVGIAGVFLLMKWKG